MNAQEQIRRYYAALSIAYGPQRWWPAQTRFEVIIGAYLTQNTAWKNVEQALRNLRRAGVLSVDGIRRIALLELELLLRPSGYFRQKAARLKIFIAYLDHNYQGSLRRMFAQPTMKLRAELLGLNGIGPETADSILLYAGNHPIFVVDAYTRRILGRHGILSHKAKYEEVRTLVEDSYRASGNHEQLAQQFNEFHALIVSAGKNHCNAAAKCEGCPLQQFLPVKD